MYVEVIGFLQNQYAGSTSISALDRIVSLSVKLRNERQNIDSEMKKAKECHENSKQQQETLNDRLQIVESLKDILEQQIGSNSVQDIMQQFSEYSQYTLNVRVFTKFSILYFISTFIFIFNTFRVLFSLKTIFLNVFRTKIISSKLTIIN